MIHVLENLADSVVIDGVVVVGVVVLSVVKLSISLEQYILVISTLLDNICFSVVVCVVVSSVEPDILGITQVADISN